MPLLLFLLSFLLNLLASAVPHAHHPELVNSEKPLEARQVIEAYPSVACCSSCSARYDYDTFWHVFDDFCGWAGNGMELWTMQTYYTGDYYCEPDTGICIHLVVQYLCGGPSGNAYPMDYGGCMDYFLFAINPVDTCGGSPYPGARIESPDQCWIMQATADSSTSFVSRIELECDDSGRWCHLPGSNDTMPVPLHAFKRPSNMGGMLR